MKVRETKYRYLIGEPLKERFEGVEISTASSEGDFIKSNGVFTAIPWHSGGGGVLAIVKAYDFQKLTPNIPMLRGHSGPILDWDFSPFNDYLLATCAEDAAIKLWILPPGGLTSDLKEEAGILSGHTKKLVQIKFHPSADYTLASASADQTVKIWDVHNQECAFSIGGHKNFITSMDWNYNGQYLATVAKDKTLRVIDPRQQQIAGEILAHEGGKPQKVCWLGRDNKLVTCGFSKVARRQYAIWDIKNLSQPLVMKGIDENQGVTTPYFDIDLNIVYFVGRGEAIIRYYEITSSDSYLEYLDSYKGAQPQKGASFLPKRAVDPMRAEVMRCVRLSLNQVEYVSFMVPRKSEAFQEDLYPPVVSSDPALTFEEWANGETREPLRIPMNPKTEDNMKKELKKIEFKKRLEGKVPAQAQEDFKQNTSSSSSEGKLTKELTEANNLIETQRKEITKLQAQLNKLLEENRQLKGVPVGGEHNQDEAKAYSDSDEEKSGGSYSDGEAHN